VINFTLRPMYPRHDSHT